MFPLANQIEQRKITICSLVSCIYLPSIITVISYKGLLYSVGNGSSFYILVLIFIAELLKSFYLNSCNDGQTKRSKVNRNKVSDIFKYFAFLIVVMCCYLAGIILFGAPALDSHEETLMLSALMTLLTVFPLVAHVGIDTGMQMLFQVRKYPKDGVIAMLVYNANMTVFGAWLGAVVIPLDWNTPWQKWPIPCYLGAIGGYLLANVYNVLNVPLVTLLNKYPALNFVITVMNKFDVGK